MVSFKMQHLEHKSIKDHYAREGRDIAIVYLDEEKTLKILRNLFRMKAGNAS